MKKIITRISNYCIRYKWYRDYLAKRVYNKNLRKLNRRKRDLSKAVKLANARSASMNGRKVYVIPDWKGNLKVLTRTEIELLKRKKIMSKKVDALVLQNEALYVAGK